MDEQKNNPLNDGQGADSPSGAEPAAPIQPENPYAAQPAQPANPYAAQPQPAQPEQPANPYAVPAQEQPAQAQPQPAQQPTNPYQQTYGQANAAAAQPVQPVQSQPENPYAAQQSQQPANPYAAQPAQPAQQPTSPYAAQPAQQQPANPYAATQPAQPVNPYAAQQPQQPQQPTSPYDPYAASQAGYQQPYGAPQTPVPVSTGKATGALVCGIFAILLSFVMPLIGLILGIVAIVLAGSYFKQGGVAGTAKAGRVCGVIGIVLSIVITIAGIILGVAVFNDIMDDYNKPSSTTSLSSPSSSSSSSSAYDSSDLYTDEEKAAIAVVSAEWDKIANGDEATLQAIAAMAEQSFTEGTDLTMAECGIDPMEYARLMTQGFEYDITLVLASENSDGFVAADVKVRDIFDVLDRFNDSLSDLESSNELNSMTQEAAKARVGELFMQAVQEADYDDDGYFSVDVSYENGKWVIDEDSWNDEMDYFFNLL